MPTRMPLLVATVVIVVGVLVAPATSAVAQTPVSSVLDSGGRFDQHPPDGLIAFTSETTAGAQLFTVQPDGTGLRQITHVAGDAGNVDWSSDGRRITFAVGDENSARIAIARGDGSELKLLPQPADVFDDQPSFTPDGKRIYFERFTVATNDDAIWSMTSNGKDQRRILGLSPNGSVTDPNISPDGRTLSFQGSDGSVVGPPPNLEPARGLFTADLKGRHIVQIRPFTADETIKAAWAPNGLRIGVTENANHFRPDTSANIVTVRPDGSRLQAVTRFQDPSNNAYLGSYSPDGRWLVFRLESGGLFGLYRIHPDGSQMQAILPLSTFRPSLIDWGRGSPGRDY